MNAFVDFPKPLIALVNGPAVGVSVTTLGLVDVVYATDRVSISTLPTVGLQIQIFTNQQNLDFCYHIYIYLLPYYCSPVVWWSGFCK